MSKKNKPSQGISREQLAAYQQQCDAITQDWVQLRTMIDTYPSPEANKAQLEWDLISLKSKLSCDYPVLTAWRKGGFGLSTGINKMLAGATNLATMADSGQNPESRVNRTWREVQTSLQKVNSTLRQAQEQLAKGKEARLPDELLVHNTHRPFPVKKVLRGIAIAVALVLSIATLYVMRNFLGFWAPGEGEGLIVDESMSNEDKINSVMVMMNEAFKRDDVDMFMTLFANDFKDEEGNSKTALRVALQAYHQKGDFGAVTVDWSRIELLEKEGIIYARPVYIRTKDDEIVIHLGFKSYKGKLLIATGSAT